MDNALTPREIQARIRAGASVADVAEESGMDVARIEAFAGPVLAEREHIAGAAQAATIRRRGETGTHRKLGELIAQRLTSRGIDPDAVTWDAWRQPDLKWRVVARLQADVEPESREAAFVFDPKARFSVADNTDARWMIGEEARGGARPEDENTVDFHDELALVRAVTQPEPVGDEVPSSELMLDGNEDTSQLDRLYDMLSGISEDSVRIYTGILDPVGDDDSPAGDSDISEEETVVVDTRVEVVQETPQQADQAAAEEPHDPEADEPTVQVLDDAAEPSQEPLVESAEPKKKAPRPRKRRASVPTWDEIMFGGPTS